MHGTTQEDHRTQNKPRPHHRCPQRRLRSQPPTANGHIIIGIDIAFVSVDDSAGLLLCVVHQRLLVARGWLLCAQTFPRRLAALEFEAARCHHPHRHCRRHASRGLLPFPPPVASFASSPPAESANKAGKKGCGGRETTPTAAPTAAQTPALPLPTRPIEPSLYPTVDFNAMDGWSSRDIRRVKIAKPKIAKPKIAKANMFKSENR